eukprot:1593662-Rhodomonas_salina.1
MERTSSSGSSSEAPDKTPLQLAAPDTTEKLSSSISHSEPLLEAHCSSAESRSYPTLMRSQLCASAPHSSCPQQLLSAQAPPR